MNLIFKILQLFFNNKSFNSKIAKNFQNVNENHVNENYYEAKSSQRDKISA
jgi:hypothetical protein